MRNLKSMASGFIVGIVAGAVWQNTIKLGAIIALVMLGQRFSSAFSIAKNMGLLASFFIIVFYTWRVRNFANALNALAKSIVSLSFAVLYFGGVGAFFYNSPLGNSRETSVKILVISFAVSALFFVIGKLIYRRQRYTIGAM